MPVSFSWTVQSASGAAAAAAVTPGEQSGADAERDWALDPVDGDLQIGTDGDGVWVAGDAAIASDLQSEFLMFLEEWYLDLQAGFPWFQEFLGEKLDETRLRRRVEEAARRVPGVVELQSYQAIENAQERSVVISFEAKCNTGAVITATATLEQGAA